MMRMLKKALIAYVNSMKAIWSAIAHPLSIVSKRKGTLKGYRIYGNSVQEGEPTPENPIEVQSVGELTVNMFDKESVERYAAYINVSENKWYSIDDSLSLVVKCDPNTTYTISHSHDSMTIFRCCYITEEDPTKITTTPFYFNVYNAVQSSSISIKALTLTTGEDATYLVIQFRKRLFDEAIETLQIQEGSTANDYEPYHKYKVPVTVRGKNLLKPLRVSAGGINTTTSSATKTNGFGTTLNTTNALEEIIVTQSTANKPSNIHGFENGYFCLEIGSGILKNWKSYILSFDCEVTNSLLDSNLIRLLPNGGNNSLKDFNVVNGRNSIVFDYTIYNGVDNYIELRNCGKSLKISNIMITDKDGTPIYEPYIEPQIHNIYLDEPLRKIGDYADCIDGEKSVVVRKIQKKVYKGTEWWQYDEVINENGFHHYFDNKNITTSLDSNKKHVISNRLLSVTWGYLWNNYYKSSGATDLRVGVALTYAINDKLIYVRITPYSTLPTIEEWKAQLTTWYEEGNPFTVWYVIPTEEEPIELPKLPQFKGTTIYEVQGNIVPSGMEVCYYE